MLHLFLTHWLWVFGALALGIVLGWATYLRVALRWTDLSVQIVIAVLALGAIAAFAKVVPGRYGYWLDLGVILAVAYAVGGFIGRALRDLAEFTPATTKAGAAAFGATASTATPGSYLFRDTFASMGTGAPYMRAASPEGAPARRPLGLGDGALPRAPAPGGYTFPKTLPFADAPARQAAAPAPGVRRHWSWPRPAETPPYVTPEFTGSLGGYVFPVAAAVAAGAARDGRARTGLYRHWSWRGGAGAPPTSEPAAAGSPAPTNVAEGSQDAPVVPGPIEARPTAAVLAPAVPAAPEATTPAAMAKSVPADARSAASLSTAPTTGPSSVPPSAGPASAGAGHAGSPAPVAASNVPTSGGVSSDSSGTAAGSVEPPPASPASTASAGAVSPATGQPTFPDKTSSTTPEAGAPAAPIHATREPSDTTGGPSIASTGVGGAPTREAASDASASGAIGAPDAPVPLPPTATTPAEAGLPAAPPTTPGQPATIAAVPGEDRHPGARPEGLMTARDDRADDLTRIRGIGPQNEGRLHGLGIWHFDQIAGWSPDNVRWVGSYLAFPGRIDREKWVEQATTLSGGGDTGVSKRIRAGTMATSHDDGS